MRIFADTSRIEELRELDAWAPISGVTTNPKIMRQDGIADVKAATQAICAAWPAWPVSVEVTTNDPDEMVAQAHEIDAWADNIVVKIPATPEGYRAAKALHAEVQRAQRRIRINFTCCMSASQVMVAGLLGCEYVSLFWGRYGDMGYDAAAECARCAELLLGTESKLIVGSVRSVADVMQAFLSRADIVTIPPDILRKLILNPKTDQTVAEFLAAATPEGVANFEMTGQFK